MVKKVSVVFDISHLLVPIVSCSSHQEKLILNSAHTCRLQTPSWHHCSWMLELKKTKKGVQEWSGSVWRNEDGGVTELLAEALIVFPLTQSVFPHHFWFSFPGCSGGYAKQAGWALMILGRLDSSCSWLDPNIPFFASAVFLTSPTQDTDWKKSFIKY